MTTERKVGENTVNSSLEEFYKIWRSQPGFSGAELAFVGGESLKRRTLGIRLFLTPSSFKKALAQGTLPESNFLGLPVSVESADFKAVPSTGLPSRSQSFITNGLTCSSQNGGGQISLMVVERETGDVGFLTALSSVADVKSDVGAPIFERPHPPAAELPIAHLSSVQQDRYGSAAFCKLTAGRPWLPIVRPRNQAITSLKVARPGERLNVGSDRGLTHGVGIYRIRESWTNGKCTSVDMEGCRVETKNSAASGALVYDEATASAAGIVVASDCVATDRFTHVTCSLPRIFASLGLRLAGFEDLLNGPQTLGTFSHSVDRKSFLDDPRELKVSDFEDPRRILLPNHRLDIVTVIWPAVKGALSFRNGNDLRLTDRLESHFPMGDYFHQLANILSGSEQLHALGLEKISARDLNGVATFDQLCERINDLLESVH